MFRCTEILSVIYVFISSGSSKINLPSSGSVSLVSTPFHNLYLSEDDRTSLTQSTQNRNEQVRTNIHFSLYICRLCSCVFHSSNDLLSSHSASQNHINECGRRHRCNPAEKAAAFPSRVQPVSLQHVQPRLQSPGEPEDSFKDTHW